MSSFSNAIILIANASVSASSFDEAVLAFCFGGMSLALLPRRIVQTVRSIVLGLGFRVRVRRNKGMNQCSVYRSCAVGSALEHSPVMRATGVRNQVAAWNFRILYVNAHAEYG